MRRQGRHWRLSRARNRHGAGRLFSSRSRQLRLEWLERREVLAAFAGNGDAPGLFEDPSWMSDSGAGVDVVDAPRPVISIADAARYEGNSGFTPLTFQVWLSSASGTTVTVDFATEPVTASAEIDFAPTSGTLSFLPGETQKTITVQMVGDMEAEGDETFRVVLSNAQGAELARGVAMGTILDDPGDELAPDALEAASNNSHHAPTEVELLQGHAEVAANIHQGGSGELIDFFLNGPQPGENLPGDWDFYRFQLDHDATVRVEVIAARQGSTLDGVLSLLRQVDGRLRILATSDDAIGLDPAIQQSLTAGEYLIAVAGAQGTKGEYRLVIDAGIVPQVVKMTPATTIGHSPDALTLFLNEEDLNAETVLAEAFRLVGLDPAGNVSTDRSDLLGAPQYDAVSDRITIPLLGPLADGRYRLIAHDSIRSARNIPLDGDGQHGAGGDFVGTFAVDTAAPALVGGSLTTVGVGGVDGVRFRVFGELIDAFPAHSGDPIMLELDLDGDDRFDDGTSLVALTDGTTSFAIYATHGLPSGTGSRVLKLRMIDGAGNVSDAFAFTVDTDAQVLIDSAAPVIRSVQIANVAFAGVTNAQPIQLLVDVMDVFPDASTLLWARVDADQDGRFNDGQATSVFTTSGHYAVVPVMLNKVLSDGLHHLNVQVTDAAGNAATRQIAIVVDTVGPRVRSTQVSIPKQPDGLPTGFVEVRISVNEELNAQAAEDLRNFRLIAAGADGDLFDFDPRNDYSNAMISAVYTPRDPQTGVPPTITITIDFRNLPADNYQLVARGGGIIDRAGNPLLGGDLRASFQYDPTPPRVVSVRPATVHEGEAAQVVVVQFAPQELEPLGVTQTANYLLEPVGQQGAAIAITSVRYDPFTNRAILYTAAPLDAGSYRLTIFAEPGADGVTGIVSRTGIVLDGDADGQPGGVAVFEFNTSTSAPLAWLLHGTQNALAQYTTQVTLDAAAARKSFASAEFAWQLLNRLRMDAGAFADSAALAAEINRQLIDLLSRQYASAVLDALARHDEFLVVWGRSTRFLLSDGGDTAASRHRVGFNANGLRIEEIAGAILVEATFGGETISLAIVPVAAFEQFRSTDLPRRGDESFLPNLRYRLELEGLAPTNQAGVLVIHDGRVHAYGPALVDVPMAARVRSFDMSNVLSGFDPNIAAINDLVRAHIEAYFGPLGELDGNLIFGWFDPVDYVLSDASGDSVGAIEGKAFQDIVGGFSATNGATGLIVVPGGLASSFQLDLYGLGTAFRGALNFASGGNVTYVPFQGLLPQGASLTNIRFGSAGPGGGDGGNPGDGGSGGTPGGGGVGGDTSGGGSGGAPGGGGTGAATRDLAGINGVVVGIFDPRDSGRTTASSPRLSPLFNTLTSFFAGDSLSLVRLSNLAGHVGRQGITAIARQLRVGVLRNLRSVRGTVLKASASADLTRSVDKLIEEFSEADPENLDSFWQLEPQLESFIDALGGPQQAGELSLQLRMMRVLRDAVEKMNERSLENGAGPVPLGLHGSPRFPQKANDQPMISLVESDQPPGAAPVASIAQTPPVQTPHGGAPNSAGEPQHVDQP